MRMFFKLTPLQLLMASALLCGPARGDDGTVVKDVSPDKHYEVRKAGNATDTIEIAELRERKGDKLLLDFAQIYGLKGKAEDSITLWRPDSGAFAYEYLFLKSGICVVYRKEKDGFKALEVPALPPMKTDDGKEIKDVDLNISLQTTYPIKWEKNGTLILEEFRVYNAGGPWETTYRKIVVNVPAKGPLTLKEVKRIEDSMKPEEKN